MFVYSNIRITKEPVNKKIFLLSLFTSMLFIKNMNGPIRKADFYQGTFGKR